MIQRVFAIGLTLILFSSSLATVPTDASNMAGPYACNGALKAFTFSFALTDDDDLKVVLYDSAGTPTVLTKSTHYTMRSANSNNLYDWSRGGTVTTVATYAAGNTIVLYRATPGTQLTNLAGNLEVIETALDKLTYEVQDSKAMFNRCLKIQVTDTGDTVTLPIAGTAGYVYRAVNGNYGIAAPLASQTTVHAYWAGVLDEPNLPDSLTAMAMDPAARQFILDTNDLDRANAIAQNAIIDANWFGADGNGVTDDTSSLQEAVDYAIAHGREFRLGAGTYRITDTLIIGTGTSVVSGFRMIGDGLPTILWDGDPNGLVMDVVSLEDSTIEGLFIDGNDCTGVTGLKIRAAATFPSQHVMLKQVSIANCQLYGGLLVQDANATCDYITLEDSVLYDNGVNLRIEGDVRQVTCTGGAFLTATTYALDVNEGCFAGYNTFFGRSGTADIYLGGALSGLSLHTSKHESDKILETGPSAASYSPLTPGIVFDHVSQDFYKTPWTEQVAVDYNCYKTFKLVSCHFIGDVNIGTSSLNVTSDQTEFVPSAYTGVTAGFTGDTDRVSEIGRGTDGYPNYYNGPIQIVQSPPWYARIQLLSMAEDYYQPFYSSDVEPNTPYLEKGAVVFNNTWISGDYAGWICTTAGDPGTSTPAVLQPFGPIGTGSGVGGSDTQVQFNDGGLNLGGDAGLTYNKTTDSLTAVGTVTAANFVPTANTSFQMKTVTVLIDIHTGGGSDYNFDATQANTTAQILNLANVLVAYAEGVSCQMRCIEAVGGPSSIAFSLGTSSGGSELTTGSANTVGTIFGLGVGGWPVPAAASGARSVYVQGVPTANWNTAASTGRWLFELTYLDKGSAYTLRNP
jgi:hypothetical protein